MIIYGTKARHKGVGVVGEWCDACRGPRIHGVTECWLAPHIYFVPVWPYSFFKHFATCGECGKSRTVDLATYTQVLPAADGLSVEDVVAQTHPGLEARTEAFRKARAGEAVDRGSREQALHDLLMPYELRLRERAAALQVNRRSAIAIAALFVLPYPVYRIARLIWSHPYFTGGTSITVLVLCLGYATYAIVRDLRFFMDERIMPDMAAELRSFKPNLGDLDRVLQDLREEGSRLPRLVSSASLLNHISGASQKGRPEPDGC